MAERSYRWQWPYRELPSGRSVPAIPVVFTYTRSTRQYYGLVDSGAEGSVCSEAIAREAGLDLGRFPRRRVRGIGGVIRARVCPLDLGILGRRIATEFLVVETDLVLLGRSDVFAAFQFGFDERASTLLIEPYDEP